MIGARGREAQTYGVFAIAIASRAALSVARDITLGVRRREEPGFELRRREIDAAVEHRMEEAAVGGGVGFERGLEVGHGLAA